MDNIFLQRKKISCQKKAAQISIKIYSCLSYHSASIKPCHIQTMLINWKKRECVQK